MPLHDSYTKIDADVTIDQIRAALRRHGARSLSEDFDEEGHTVALAFTIPTRFGLRPFRLPANVAGVARVMERQYADGQVRRRPTPLQARRTAWRILKDWLDAQLAITEAGMVNLDQVLLPYMQGAGGVTVYEWLVEQRFLLPAPKEGQQQ